MHELHRLPGAQRFFRHHVEGLLSSRIAFLRAPFRVHESITEGLTNEIKQLTGDRPVRVNCKDEPNAPARTIALRTPGMDRSSQSPFDFVNSLESLGRRFLIYGIDPRTWRRWRIFLKDVDEIYRSEAFEGQEDLPGLIVLPPPGVPVTDFRELGGGNIIDWKGVLARNDVASYADMKFGPVNGLVSRAARETSIELAGWNLSLLDLLLQLDEEEQLNPMDYLSSLMPEETADTPATWENGDVDWWSEEIRVDTAFLLQQRRIQDVHERLWRAHVRSIFEVVDVVRQAILRKYQSELSERVNAKTPYVIETRGIPIEKISYRELEIGDLLSLNKKKGYLTSTDLSLLIRASDVRKLIAHMRPVTLNKLQALADCWEGPAAHLNGEPGWDWPRSGQVLTIMVGPAGAGKTTWAKKNHPGQMISRDEIRASMPKGTSSTVEFARFRELGRKRLSEGRSVVMDATHIRRERRLAIRALAPPDIKVRYVVIDRPLADKIETGGWRNTPEKEGMIQIHHDEFAAELGNILSGDGDLSVEIVDLRQGDAATELRKVS